MSVELTQGLLAEVAGWEVVKQAREVFATGRVRGSSWSPPFLRGKVQEGTTTYQAGLVIKNKVDVENLCSCRRSRQEGFICAHSVAVGLHYIRSRESVPLVSSGTPPTISSNSAVAKIDKPLAAQVAGPPRKPVRRLTRAPAGSEVDAEMFVIFPPNLEQAIAKGRVMIVFEVKWDGGRCPLNAVPLASPLSFSEQDFGVLDEIENLTGGEPAGTVLLTLTQLGNLINSLVNHPRLTLGKARSLAVIEGPLRLRLTATLERSGEIRLELAEKVTAVAVPSRTSIWTYQAEQFRPLGLPELAFKVLEGPMALRREEVPRFLAEAWPRLVEGSEVTANFRLEDFICETTPPRVRLFLKGGLAHLEGRLEFAYPDLVVALGQAVTSASGWMPDSRNPTRYWVRDLATEQAAQARLVSAGFSGPHSGGSLQLAGQEQVLKFFARDFPRLQRSWEVNLEERLQRSTAQNLERIEPSFQVTSSGESWFDLEIAYQSSSGERLSAAEVHRLLRSGQHHARLGNGRLALMDCEAINDLQEVLRDCSPEQQGNRFRLGQTQAPFLASTIQEQAGWRLDAPSAWRQGTTSTAETLPGSLLGELAAVLRPYQKQGVAWLWSLRQRGFGGILADEMGLGKTVQALAYMQAMVLEDVQAGRPPRCRPTLVVCPTSLVFNWLAEAARYTPRLRVLELHGPRRQERFAQVAHSDLVVTSYALIRRDAELYENMEFDTVVLDEAQHIKNRQTQNALAVKGVRASHRFVLTGTPLENSILDLWSIFDFLMPGYLGPAAEFRERYEQPITRERDPAAQNRLARRVRPFLLRRLKREVAPDLPARLEQVSFCDLTQDQAAVYREILEASRKEVLAAVDQQGFAKSRMLVLTALLRLRQVCCDLRLLGLDHVEPEKASAKLEMFGELLQEALDGGHRVLVFSQFVKMLGLVKEKLQTDGIEFCYLDGSTIDRAGAVQRFQQNEDIPVFLISLKAGGTGLNLTGADTVVHLDPWWNPAVEAQATDRAHRFGQTRVVTSYKLITRGTVEEKILNLQTKKREIFQAALGGEEQLSEALSWDQVQELLAE